MKNVAKAELKVELIDVGHGDALLLHWISEEGNTSTILIDGGPSNGGQRIKETLERVGATAIDLAVLSHCDADHVDGLLAYAEREDQLPIRRYWGPCLPAYDRHSWLFPERIKRGLGKTKLLQEALESNGCAISWPVEGASWTSSDGGLSIKILAPAGRLIERLLLGEDSLSLFLERPMPLGWLLAGKEDALSDEDSFADLRFAISTGEITPDRVPSSLPSTPDLSTPEQFAGQAAEQGIEPEFFGNSVLNDTSIVLLVEARLGFVQRRLLFTGDLENFTYLMARWPLGLSCEVVKAPHHGSYSFVDRDKAYDAVWQWLRPRAVLVSANGEHGLPRIDFRDAALRYGATLFCTSRRSREIVSGPITEACCNTQYACRQIKQAPVSLSITSLGIDADGIACARGNLSSVMPVIEVRQHLIEPSPILATLAETEIRKHSEWLVKWLRKTLRERRDRPARSDLEPISLDVLRKAAVTDNRLAAAVEMEVILERAAREGKVWISRDTRFRSADRRVWVMPDCNDLAKLKAWIDRYIVVQLAVKEAKVASGVQELLYSADTSWLADRLAEDLFFPRAMFEDILWPTMVSHLLQTRSIGVRTLTDNVSSVYGAATIIVLFNGGDISKAAAVLTKKIEAFPSCDDLRTYLQESAEGLGYRYGYKPGLTWPRLLEKLVSPLWLGKVLPPSGLMLERWLSPISPVGTFNTSERSIIQGWVKHYQVGGETNELPTKLVPVTLSALTLAGFDVVSNPSLGRERL